MLEIPLYEDLENKIFCYKFHDTMIAVSNIGLQIRYQQPRSFFEDPDVKDSMTEKLISRAKKQQMDQLKKTKFILTDFHSGHIASIMILYSHLRKWKRKDLRQISTIVDLSRQLIKSCQHIPEIEEEEERASVKENSKSIAKETHQVQIKVNPS